MENEREKISASLSVVMPVYNEADVIEKVVRDFCGVLNKFERPEFIIVNDCSKDDTALILNNLAKEFPYLRVITQEKNSGHGPSLIKAYGLSTGEYIFHADSDNQFYAEDFWLIWQKMHKESADVVIGHRHERQDAFHRILITKALRVVLFILLGANIKDSNSPFKLHKRAALDKILPLIPQNAFVPSILMAVAAQKLKMKVLYQNVRHLPRLTGTTFIKSWKIFKICWKAMKETIKFRISLKNI